MVFLFLLLSNFFSVQYYWYVDTQLLTQYILRIFCNTIISIDAWKQMKDPETMNSYCTVSYVEFVRRKPFTAHGLIVVLQKTRKLYIVIRVMQRLENGHFRRDWDTNRAGIFRAAFALIQNFVFAEKWVWNKTNWHPTRDQNNCSVTDLNPSAICCGVYCIVVGRCQMSSHSPPVYPFCVHSNKERALYFSAPSKYTFFGARCDPRLSIGKVSYGMHVCICTYHPNVVNVTKYRQSTTWGTNFLYYFWHIPNYDIPQNSVACQGCHFPPKSTLQQPYFSGEMIFPQKVMRDEI